MDEEVRQRRRKKLVEGNCSICKAEPAQIPWMEKKYCYYCWSVLWKAIQKEAINEKIRQEKAEKKKEKRREEKIESFLKNQ